VNGVDNGLIVAESHGKTDVRFGQNAFFNTLHQKADDIAGGDAVQTIVVAQILCLNNGADICVFAAGPKGPHIFIFRSFGETALVFTLFDLGDFAAIDRTSETSLVSDIVFFYGFFIDMGGPVEFAFLKVSHRVNAGFIH